MKEINWWLSQFNFSQKEKLLLAQKRKNSLDINENEYSELTKQLSNMLIMPMDYTLTIDTCATDLINYLFSKYVDDETLVICTSSEHPSVKENLKKCKNVQYIVRQNLLQPIENLYSYPKVFMYFIGTSVGDGQYTGNSLVYNIKKELQSKGIKTKIVLDAVQELFFIPRDYSLYDYVIGTAHAIIPGYDMGMLWSKSVECTGVHNCIWLSDFLQKVQILLKRKQLLFYLLNIMESHFYWLKSMDANLYNTSKFGWTYNLCDKKQRLEGLQKGDKEYFSTEHTAVTFRSCPFVCNPEEYLQKIQLIDQILKETI